MAGGISGNGHNGKQGGGEPFPSSFAPQEEGEQEVPAATPEPTGLVIDGREYVEGGAR